VGVDVFYDGGDPPRPIRAEGASSKSAQLDRERVALSRWRSRLRRAFHALEKRQQRVIGPEKQLAQLDDSRTSYR